MNDAEFRSAVVDDAPSTDLASKISAHIVGLEKQGGHDALTAALALPGIHATAKTKIQLALANLDAAERKADHPNVDSELSADAKPTVDSDSSSEPHPIDEPGQPQEPSTRRSDTFGR